MTTQTIDVRACALIWPVGPAQFIAMLPVSTIALAGVANFPGAF
jgi:hypothetical protein